MTTVSSQHNMVLFSPSMSKTIVIKLTLLFMFSEHIPGCRGSNSNSIISSASIILECSLPGLCHGTLVDYHDTSSFANCVLLGRSTPTATWVTFNQAERNCAALASCDDLDDNMIGDVLSGRVDCRLCAVVGACRGLVLVSLLASNVDECLSLCTA